MRYDKHKLKTALYAVVAIIAIYSLYNLISGTPKIQIAHVEPQTVDDPNQQTVQDQPVDVGAVSIGTLEMARFSTLDPKTKVLQREFGFERLLHQEGSQWEIEKPYMNIFRPELTCYITADTGSVVLEADVSPPNPTDATLTGNVVAHIVPTPGSDVAEGFIYLDDLTFISGKSRFFTAGPVSFVSDQAQMQAKGLEIIYDDQNKRLELLRINELEHLQLKVQKAYSLTRDDSSPAQSAADVTVPGSERKDAESYTCVFSKNVVIDSGEQFVAADQLRLSNIIWSDSKSDSQPQSGQTETVDQQPEQRVEPEPQDLIEIAVSCDNGIVIVPSNSLDTLKKIEGFLESSGGAAPIHAVEDQPGRTTFAAELIDYDLATRDATAPGKSRLTLYVNDVMSPDQSDSAVPVIITADELAKFSPDSNRIIFQGNSNCRMIRYETDVLQEYVLDAPLLIVELEEEKSSAGSLADVRRISAIGLTPTASRLSSIKKDDEKFLGGIELKCPRFEYDAREQMFLATGPGIIKADNSQIPQPQKDVGRFSMQKPCYAIVRNFETLRYFLRTERIVADNSSERIFIDYFPIDNGTTQQVTVTAGHIEADLVETSAGRYRLWSLLAKDGISFKDKDKTFEASELLYDDKRSVVLARGSDAMPVYFNGLMFDGIEYDLVTEEVKKVEISGPGFFRATQ